ncbi:MAG: hypothetical protein KDB22_14940 [Planctomycetales bacterium]|nr:hypothetical protein [Planctomycetales bacterium]
MKKVLMGLLMASLALVSAPARANSKLKADFAKIYADEKADKEFVDLVKKAGCWVCHVDGEDKKKVRNPYGKSLHEMLEKDKFPMAEYKKDPAKYADRLKEIFKKVEAEKSGDEEHKTFGDRIKAKLLPGGNIKGKKDE